MLNETYAALKNSEIHAALNDNNFTEIMRLLGNDHTEYSTSEDVTGMETIGQLVDKLTIVNLKMWHNQEVLYSVRRQSSDEFIKRWEGNLPELHNILKRCTDLNVQRARLMDEIDRKLVAAFTGQVDPTTLAAPQHKTY